MYRKKLLRISDVPDHQALQESDGAPHLHWGEGLRLLVWNVRKGLHREWRGDFVRLATACDLILLQEAFHDGEEDHPFHPLENLSWAFARTFENRRAGHTTGVATAANVPPIESQYVRSPGREPLIKTSKMALVTRYPCGLGGENILVVNVHGNLAVTRALFHQQMSEIASPIKAHSGPVIWAGDFNTWSPWRIKLVRALAKEMGLCEVAFPAGNPTSFLGRAIDLVFLRGFRVEEAIAHREIKTSDHKPLTLLLSREVDA